MSGLRMISLWRMCTLPACRLSNSCLRDSFLRTSLCSAPNASSMQCKLYHSKPKRRHYFQNIYYEGSEKEKAEAIGLLNQILDSQKENIFLNKELIQEDQSLQHINEVTTKLQEVDQHSNEKEIINATPEVQVIDTIDIDKLPLSLDEGDWEKEMQWIKEQDSGSLLDPPKSMEVIECYKPAWKPSFNIAGFVKRSEDLQMLVKIGVDLSHWETKDFVKDLLILNFQKDIVPHLFFLHGRGVPVEKLGRFLSKCPEVLLESIENLETRINYLEAKKFQPDDIARIISVNTKWLSYSVKEIDEFLGYIQSQFQLTGDEVRFLAVRSPRVITQKRMFTRRVAFTIMEELAYDLAETKELLLSQPRIFQTGHEVILQNFRYLHKDMLLSHEDILKNGKLLKMRLSRMKSRHGFLKLLKKDQFDPRLPGFISFDDFARGSNEEFVTNVAKSNMKLFNDFIKTE